MKKDEVKNDRITEVTKKNIHSRPCSSGIRETLLLMTMSSQVLNTPIDEDSTMSLGNLFQCSTIFTVKGCFL